MTRYNWIGVILFAAIFSSSFLNNENASLFLNQIGLLVVVSGTLGAVFLSYPTTSIVAW